MPFSAAAAALQSSLCCSSKSSSTPFNSQASSSSNLDTQLAAKPKSLLHKYPLYTSTHTKLSLQSKRKSSALKSWELMQAKPSPKTLISAPRLSTPSAPSSPSSTPKSSTKRTWPRSLGCAPTSSPPASSPTDLNPVFAFLSEDLKVPDYNFRMVINKCPRLLASSVKNQLKPALSYLQRLGFKDLNALAYHDSVLLVSNVERTLVPKLEYLERLGFPREEAVGMVLRCPGLLTFSIENNLKPKFEYFSVEMGKGLEELKGFPQYFAFSLEKRVRPRHLEVVERGVEVPLPLMLKSTDEEFRELLRELGGG